MLCVCIFISHGFKALMRTIFLGLDRSADLDYLSVFKVVEPSPTKTIQFLFCV